MANGNNVYTGPSQINGQPIKAVLTGTANESKNTKTGDMAQLWLLSTIERPTEAAKSGNDESVCGNCPRRPLRAPTTGLKRCYVNLGQAPNAIYAATYPEAIPTTIKKPVRLGAYAEPTVVPLRIIQQLINNADGHTGYTHQWRDPRFSGFKSILMASVDSEAEALEAQALGWRTFRARRPSDAIMAGEIECPATREAGYRTTCDRCQLCAGTSRQAKNITEVEH
jgi:hypothetical protein